MSSEVKRSASHFGRYELRGGPKHASTSQSSQQQPRYDRLTMEEDDGRMEVFEVGAGADGDGFGGPAADAEGKAGEGADHLGSHLNAALAGRLRIRVRVGKDVGMCTKFCFLLSVSGILFLTFVGILMRTQPRLVRVPGVEGNGAARDERIGDLGGTCFWAAGIYLLTALLSGIVWMRAPTGPAAPRGLGVTTLLVDDPGKRDE